MKKEVVRSIVIKSVLSLLAVFILMVVIGAFVPVGNKNPESDNVFPSDFSLLNFDKSRNYQKVEMSDLDGVHTIYDNIYQGDVVNWKEDADEMFIILAPSFMKGSAIAISSDGAVQFILHIFEISSLSILSNGPM